MSGSGRSATGSSVSLSFLGYVGGPGALGEASRLADGVT